GPSPSTGTGRPASASMIPPKQRREEARSPTSEPLEISDPEAKKPCRSMFVLLGLLAAGLLLPSLFYPFGRDQGVFAYAGSVILRGGWPYRDVWDVKPPGIYYTYAAMLACTGSSMAGVRACDLLAVVATTLLLRSVLRPMIGAVAAWLGALLYPAMYLRLGFWGMAQAESYANLWTAAALWAWLRGTGVQVFRCSGVQDAVPPHPLTPSPPPSLTPSIAAGLVAAAALLLKVTALPPLLVVFAVVSLLRGRQCGWRLEAAR